MVRLNLRCWHSFHSGTFYFIFFKTKTRCQGKVSGGISSALKYLLLCDRFEMIVNVLCDWLTCMRWMCCQRTRLQLCDPLFLDEVWQSQDIMFMWWILYTSTEGTPFAGGIFRMRLVLGKDFPAVPPKGYFLTKIFHPNVGHKGEICVNVLKRDWKAELGLKHVLLVRRMICVFVSVSLVLRPLISHLFPSLSYRQSSVF